MRKGEKIQVWLLAVVIAINVAVVIVLAIETGETNPLYYLGFAIPIAFMAWILRGTLRGWRTRVRAQQAGLRGKLKVLDAREIAGGVMTVNDQPYLKLELELEVPGREAERFGKQMVVPRLAIPAVMGHGTFDVWVDPKDHRRFEVEW